MAGSDASSQRKGKSMNGAPAGKGIGSIALVEDCVYFR